MPIAINAPNSLVRGTNNNTDARSSITPVPILPHGSMPNFEKM